LQYTVEDLIYAGGWQQTDEGLVGELADYRWHDRRDNSSILRSYNPGPFLG